MKHCTGVVDSCSHPYAGLARDRSGTVLFGTSNGRGGNVFRITLAGSLSVIHVFGAVPNDDPGLLTALRRCREDQRGTKKTIRRQRDKAVALAQAVGAFKLGAETVG